MEAAIHVPFVVAQLVVGTSLIVILQSPHFHLVLEALLPVLLKFLCTSHDRLDKGVNSKLILLISMQKPTNHVVVSIAVSNWLHFIDLQVRLMLRNVDLRHLEIWLSDLLESMDVR